MKRTLVFSVLIFLICCAGIFIRGRLAGRKSAGPGQNGTVTALSYTRHGGELGGRYEIVFDSEGSKLIVTEQKSADSAETKDEYPVDANTLTADIAEYVEKYALTSWKHSRSDIYALDGETVSMHIGTAGGLDFSLANDEEIPRGKENVLADFRELLLSHCKKEQ